MREYLPLLIVGGAVGAFALIFLIAYLSMKDKKEAIGFDRSMKDTEIIRRLMVYARPYRKNFLIVLLLVLISIAYDIASPVIMGRIESMVKEPFELGRLWLFVAVYAGILLISLASTFLQAIVLQVTGQKILSRLREDLFVHIESLSHAQLNQIPVGKLVTRVTNDTGAISMMFTNILVNLVKNSFIVLGVLGAMLLVNFELTLMILCFVPFIVLFTWIFRKFSRRAYRRVKDGNTDINTFLSENLTGMKIIQIFNREEAKQAEFEEKNKKLTAAKYQQIMVFGIFRPLVYMLYISSVLCLFYLGGRGVLQETVFLGQVIDGGVIVTFYMFISKFFNPIQSLAEQFNMLQSAMASAEKIFTIFDMVPEIVDAPDAIDLPSVRGEIEFKHVWFAYKEGEWVLKDVSFKVEAGQTVAFAGATGSGKTTILSLLCRNYDVQKGEILLDGIDIRHIRIASLRSHFGQMLQDVFLFSGTLRSNIELRMDGVTDEDVMKAARFVNADKIIERSPDGLDEEVRERGSNFSAGQRQLISFARTVLHRPEIMILDEATANIDTETEVLIQDSLERMMNIGTLLMVAHRLSTIQHADKIIMMSHGRIIEEGSHAELLALQGRYYRLFMLQYDKAQLKAGLQPV
ncbi:MAG: ABC transporter ATP-binding protein [Lachnospiraceae bacterium]|nr:ABC transporter ATP-binding protein [Lachnospiraceae bacterium]